MMSSCCTFRLKRRNAFSSGSPSCTRTSANELHLQTSQWGQFLEYGKLILASQGFTVATDQLVRCRCISKRIFYIFPRKTVRYHTIRPDEGADLSRVSHRWR